MTIYTPYFYIIEEISSGIYYAGIRYARDCNPNELLIQGGYTTSSTIVNNHINLNGILSFRIRKIRIFETKKEVLIYEKKFLEKVDAKNNNMFYNLQNNDHLFSYHDDRYKSKMLEIYGVDNPSKTPENKKKISDAQSGKKKPWLAEMNRNRIHPSLGTIYSEDRCKVISEQNKRIWKNYNTEDRSKRCNNIAKARNEWYINLEEETKVSMHKQAGLTQRGMVFWNNGTISIKARECPGEGWKRGRIKYRRLG